MSNWPRMTRNFSRREFTRSDTADKLGVSNMPDTDEQMQTLHVLALGMEQVRSVCGNRAVTITSGFRCKVVNEAVGGVPTSAHALGCAADFTVAGMSARETALEIAASHLVFDQLILEEDRNVCHISFDPRLRGEVKTQKDGPGSPVVWGIEP